MRLTLKLFAILAALLAVALALIALGTLMQAAIRPTALSFLLGISIIGATVLGIRCVRWLWSGPVFWAIGGRRAEVFAFASLVFGWLLAAFYVPHSDANAPAKLFFAAEAMALLAYVVTRIASKTCDRAHA